MGKIAIYNFGKKVKMLHDINSIFTDEEGSFLSFFVCLFLIVTLYFIIEIGVKVCSSFSFNQEETSIHLCLKQIVLHLKKSYEKKNAQLVFIISDGRFDSGEREQTKRWNRIAKECNQFVVLIIVESKQSQSILDLKQAIVNEAGQIKIARYLDDYPFPYYLIVNDMKELPEVLADALKQWFQVLIENE